MKVAVVVDFEELIRLAGSQSWQDRARAGRELVAHLGGPVADAVVLRLLLDTKDTAVTVATADALLNRGDFISWRMFARGWAEAREQKGMTNHIDHLYSSLNGAMYAASLSLEKSEALKRVVEKLSVDNDEIVRSTAAELHSLVSEGL